jgi:hypothetical protein
MRPERCSAITNAVLLHRGAEDISLSLRPALARTYRASGPPSMARRSFGYFREWKLVGWNRLRSDPVPAARHEHVRRACCCGLEQKCPQHHCLRGDDVGIPDGYRIPGCSNHTRADRCSSGRLPGPLFYAAFMTNPSLARMLSAILGRSTLRQAHKAASYVGTFCRSSAGTMPSGCFAKFRKIEVAGRKPGQCAHAMRRQRCVQQHRFWPPS